MDILIGIGLWFIMSFILSFGLARFIKVGKGPWGDD